MAEAEQLKETLERLEEKLKETEINCAKLEGELKGKSTTTIHHTKPEKLMQTFKPTDNVEDWIYIASSHIYRLSYEKDRVDLILNFLSEVPYTEIRFRIDRAKAHSKEVLDLLRCKGQFHSSPTKVLFPGAARK